MLEIKSTVTELKNTFHGLTSRMDTDKERASELEHLSTESLEPKAKRTKTDKNRTVFTI